MPKEENQKKRSINVCKIGLTLACHDVTRPVCSWRFYTNENGASSKLSVIITRRQACSLHKHACAAGFRIIPIFIETI